MFYLNKNTELTVDLLRKIINKFITGVRPTLRKWGDYYDGKHTNTGSVKDFVVTNYCRQIAQTYGGYIVGKPVTYTSNDNIDDIQEIINYNDDNAENIAWCMNALTYGVGYELQWLDESAQIRYSQVQPLNAFAIYDNTLDCDLLYFVRWYDVDSFDDSDLVHVEVYDAYSKKVYRAHGITGELVLISEEAHHFGDVPVSIFWLNDKEENIFNCIMPLNDAYNKLQSSEIADYSAWLDSYLLLSGMDADTADIATMKENRVLILPEGGTAQYLTKAATDTQITNMLENLKKNIFKISAAPDMGDENFMAQSGVAIEYKLVGFENTASGIVANFTKAIQRRIELMCNVLKLKASEAIWRDININFVRNLPANIAEKVALVNALKGTVSDSTLLGMLGMIDDVQAELEAVKKQKEENMSLYSFGTVHEDEEDDTENNFES